MQFIKDLFSEEKGGKYSSKKIWGGVITGLVCVAFILDGLHFYTANKDLFNVMLLTGSSLIGLTSIANIFKNGKDK